MAFWMFEQAAEVECTLEWELDWAAIGCLLLGAVTYVEQPALPVGDTNLEPRLHGDDLEREDFFEL